MLHDVRDGELVRLLAALGQARTSSSAWGIEVAARGGLWGGQELREGDGFPHCGVVSQ